jgi:hypothetical protein
MRKKINIFFNNLVDVAKYKNVASENASEQAVTTFDKKNPTLK